jgi:hypothetical protein
MKMHHLKKPYRHAVKHAASVKAHVRRQLKRTSHFSKRVHHHVFRGGLMGTQAEALRWLEDSFGVGDAQVSPDSVLM